MKIEKINRKKTGFKNASFLFTLLFFGILMVHSAFAKGDEPIILKNSKVLLKFSAENGAFISMEDLLKQKMVSNSEQSKDDSPWELDFDLKGNPRNLVIKDFSEFSHHNPNSNTLVLLWSQPKDVSNGNISVKATIKLDENNSLSSWHIAVEGLKGKTLSKVIFPKISGLDALSDGNLAVPHWMGELLQNPRAYLSSMRTGAQQFTWSYPGLLSMQFLALYNKENGFYASCDDAEIYGKNFTLSLDSLKTMVYQMENFPEANPSENVYSLSYNAVVGPFSGDWFTAAELYREWGERQSWATNSRLRAGLTPEWLTNTALWVWNRGRSEEVLTPAAELKERLGLPVNVLWHWWHGGSYDDSFPDYLPPRDGKEAFAKNVKWSQEKGIHSLVYMNQLQWGPSTASWTKENAALYTVRDNKGNMNTHVYNIFTGKALTNMCIATDFWKNKYASLADSVINFYGVDGIYMDQACISRICYDSTHGHPLGGGNYWVPNSGKLTEQIRKNVQNNKEIALSGEGSGEAWMPYLDIFLALQVSRERYAGVQGWEPIPLFQAVYHQYAISYGNYSSLLNPPYDEMWPEEDRPDEAMQPLDAVFNKQFLMEQARSFVWGMQPMISNYMPSLALERKTEIDYLLTLAKVRDKSKKFLLYGKYTRSPQLAVPEEELKISKLSIYAGQKEKVTTFQKAFPTVYCSSWMSEDNMLGIALASIDDQLYPVNMNFKSGDYGLSDSGRIYIVDEAGRTQLDSYSNGDIKVSFMLPPRGINMIEVVPD